MKTAQKIKPVPEGHHTVTPYLLVNQASDLISFLKSAFGAEEVLRFTTTDGTRIHHAEVRIGDSIVMLADANKDYPPINAMIHLYVEDTDDVYQAALQAGAISLREPADQLHGERTAGVKDAFGNQWWLATRTEDLSIQEINERMRARRTTTQQTPQK